MNIILLTKKNQEYIYSNTNFLKIINKFNIFSGN